MRAASWIGALFAGAAILAACGGGAADPDEPARQLSAGAPCQAITEIQSYRYTLSLKLDSPALQLAEGDTSEEPLSAFANALTALFADMEIDGAYVAPDRSQTILRFRNEEVELRVIGDRSWVRAGSVWQEQSTPPQEETPLTPQSVCEDIVADLIPALTGVDSRPETVNGMETDHYRLVEADLKRLPELLGPTSALPQNFVADLWLTRDGSWPIRLHITASDTDEEGRPIDLELFMEFRDINDPSIEIEPPLNSPAGP